MIFWIFCSNLSLNNSILDNHRTILSLFNSIGNEFNSEDIKNIMKSKDFMKFFDKASKVMEKVGGISAK